MTISVNRTACFVQQLSLCIGPQRKLSDFDGDFGREATTDVKAVGRRDQTVDDNAAGGIQQQVSASTISVEKAVDFNGAVRKQR